MTIEEMDLETSAMLCWDWGKPIGLNKSGEIERRGWVGVARKKAHM